MKKKIRFKVTDAELSILDFLWKQGPASIRRIADELYPGGKTSDYATVQKLLERLESKGCVIRNRKSFAHTFQAKIGRECLIDQQLEEMAEKLCSGSFTPLLVHLVERKKLKARDREMLLKLLEEGHAEST